METDTSRTPEPEDADAQDDEDGPRLPFLPHKKDDTPLGDTNEHSDADA